MNRKTTLMLAATAALSLGAGAASAQTWMPIIERQAIAVAVRQTRHRNCGGSDHSSSSSWTAGFGFAISSVSGSAMYRSASSLA